MANIGDDTLREIGNADTHEWLNRLEAFIHTGKWDDSNTKAKAMIDQRRALIDQKKKAEEYQKAVAEQTGYVNDYRKRLADIQNSMYSRLYGNARQDLSQAETNTNRGYNRKGLLYSGLRQGAIGNQRAQTASGLADARASINARTEGQVRDMENQAMRGELGAQRAGFEAQLPNMDQQDDIYGEALRRVREKQGFFNSAGQAGGAIAGAALAGRNK